MKKSSSAAQHDQQPEEIKHHVILPDRVNLDTILPTPSDEQVTNLSVDADNLKYLNSSGIRIWMQWISDLKSKWFGVKFEFSNVRPILLSHSSLIYGFFPPRSGFNSIYVPWYCESCKKHFQILFPTEKLRLFLNDSQSERCPDCQAFLDLDIKKEIILQLLW